MSSALLPLSSRVTVKTAEGKFKLRASTIGKYLPQFIRTVEAWVEQNHHGDIVVDFDAVGWFRGSTTQKCLRRIFQHLTELEHGASSALYDWLMGCYKSSRRMSGSRQYNLDIATAFQTVGKLLDKHMFGCHKTMFDMLSTFFIKNIEELSRRYRQDIFWYFIRPLDGMGKDMTSVILALSSIFDLTPFVDGLAFDTGSERPLRRSTAKLIQQMAYSKGFRSLMTPREPGYRSQSGPLIRVPPPPRNPEYFPPDEWPVIVPYSGAAGASLIRGDLLPDLEYMISRYPERFWYEPKQRRHGWSPSRSRPRILPPPLPRRGGNELWENDDLLDFDDGSEFDYDSDPDIPRRLAPSPFDDLGGFDGIRGDYFDDMSDDDILGDSFGPVDIGHPRGPPNVAFAF
ncbi:MAG: hypothetical protein M1836_005133 [Candelina mexicana]|nr:MAG: hypothetical protein M1836_005133 [Candelina mexicana]